MRPIPKRLLPHTVTILNISDDEDTGGFEAYRTILEGVRVGVVKESLSFARLADLAGPPLKYEGQILIDRRTTSAYGLDDATGAKTPKAYLDFDSWAALGAAGKEARWTLREGDWIHAIWGEPVSICPEYRGEAGPEGEFADKWRIRKVAKITPAIDKDGTIHNWEVAFD